MHQYSIRSAHMIAPTSILVLSLVLLVSGCSEPPSYERAVELIKAKEYNEAEQVLRSLPADSLKHGKFAAALVLCGVGEHYVNGRFEVAKSLLDTVSVHDGKNYYILNVREDDPLFSHAATLASLVYSESVIDEGYEYMDYFKDDIDMLDYGSDSEMMLGIEREVRKGSSDLQYQEHDYRREWQSDMPPFIATRGLQNLPTAPELNDELEAVKKKYEEFDAEREAMAVRVAEAWKAHEEFLRAQEAAQYAFDSKSEAMTWLLGWDSWIGPTAWEGEASEENGSRLAFVFRGEGRGHYRITWRVFNITKSGDINDLLPPTPYKLLRVDENRIHLIDTDGEQTWFERIGDQNLQFEGKPYRRTR